MLFTVIQVKFDKNSNEYYNLVNKDDSRCWCYVNLYDDTAIHKVDEVIELDESKMEFETRVSVSGEHAGEKYMTGIYRIREKQEWDYVKVDPVDMYTSANSKIFKCISIKENRFEPGTWVCLFLNKEEKLSIQKKLKSERQKGYFTNFIGQDCVCWYERATTKTGAKYFELKVMFKQESQDI